MKGIDISHYQGNVDFNKVKAVGIEVVYIKATEGKTYTDPNFETYYNGAKAAGLKVGVYHFLRNNSTEDEVNNFLKAMQGKEFDCKIVIDMETNFGSIEVNSQKTRAFAEALTAKGYDIALYTGESFYNHNLDSRVKNLPLWVAKYSTSKPNVPAYIGWQFSSDGSVAGINGRVDVDDFSNEILKKEENELKKIVTYFGDADLFAAVLVSQKNQCPLMRKADFDASGLKVDEIVQIGGKAGSTRYDSLKDAAKLV
jgi:lysozyme